jgi:pimeloyl-[acyl-carrier protein] methyl ester esterase
MRLFTIHGWSFDTSVWKETPLEYAEHLALPGHGGSFFRSTNIRDLAEEIGKSLPENVILAGWSLGATVALVTAALYAGKVRKLILFAPTVKFSGISQPETVVKRFLKKLQRNFVETVKEFRKLCSETSLPLPELDENAATELLKSFSYFDLSSFAGSLSVPTEILAGERDTVTGIGGAFRLHSLIPCSTLTLFPEADHLTVLSAWSL